MRAPRPGSHKLLVLLILMLASIPLTQFHHPWLDLAFALFFLGTALGTMGASGTLTRGQRIAAWALAAPIALIEGYGALTGREAATNLELVLYVLLCSFTVYCLVRFVLRCPEITADTIAIALVVYMVLGLVGGLLYALIELNFPGSFVLLEKERSSTVVLSQLIYFSFCTLTTVGLGDIQPTTSLTRSMVLLEASLGVMYPAIVLGWIVGTLANKAGPREPRA